MVAFDTALYPEATLKGLEAALTSEKFPHTLLLSGPSGIGKKALASSIAAAILCNRKDLRPCACAICRRVAERIHPDLKWISNEDNSSLKVDQIRELIDWLRFKPFEADRKILVIEGIDRLVDAALNAFLKMLEEPPESTLLILLTEAPTTLKATLLSRCFHVVLRPLSSQGLEDHLLNKGTSEAEAHYVSLAAQGIWREAEAKIAQGDFREDDARLKTLLSLNSYEVAEKYLGRSAQKRSSEEKRKIAEEFLFVTQIFLRDVFLFQTIGTQASGLEKLLFFNHRKAWIEKKAGGESKESVFRKLSKTEEIRRYLDHNANPKLALMSISELMHPPIVEPKND